MGLEVVVDSTRMRARGYYWVKDKVDYWLIAYWDGKIWLRVGVTSEFRDRDFSKIGERLAAPGEAASSSAGAASSS